MSSSSNDEHHNQESECPECKKRYISSSSKSNNHSESESNERIIIPLRKDLLGAPAPPSPQNNHVESTLKLLQSEIQNLKSSNLQKDKMIDDLKKEMEHKMTHYMIYGQINKQADQINRLKTELSYGSNLPHLRRANGINEEHIRQIAKQESRKFNERPTGQFNMKSRQIRETNSFRRKTYSTHDNYSSLRRQFLSPRESKQQRGVVMQFPKQYFNKTNKKGVLNIKQSKLKMREMERKLEGYESEMKWMMNFITTFIRSMQGVAYRKYQQQIIIPEWSLKKKAKTSWRYLKHVFNFMYGPQLP